MPATHSLQNPRYRGIFPVVPTTFHEDGRLDLDSQKRCLDFMIDAGVDGVCILANFSEQFSLSDAEREVLTRTSLEHVAGRAPASVTVLSAPFLARMAQEIENLAYFKIEVPGAASKLRELIRLGGAAIEGPWDGEEAITLLADLDAGATGAMTGGAFPDGIRPIIEAHRQGDMDQAFALYQRWLPLINHENRQGGILTAKALMKEGGVIACEAGRHPFPAMHPEVRRGLIDIARRLDPLVLRWAR